MPLTITPGQAAELAGHLATCHGQVRISADEAADPSFLLALHRVARDQNPEEDGPACAPYTHKAEREAATTAVPLAAVLADAQANGLVWMSGPMPATRHHPAQPAGVDARGYAHLMLIFATPQQRRTFHARYRGAWVELADRATHLTYDMDWKDVQGWGLVLASTDYPVACYGGRRASELPGRDVAAAR